MGYFKNPSHFTTGFQASSLIGFFNKLYFFKITKKSQHLLDKSSSPPKPNCRWATLTEIAGCWPERGDEVWRRFQLGAHFVRSWGWTSHFFFCGMFGYVQPRYSVIVIRNVMVLGMLTYPQKMHYLFSESYPADPWGTPGLFHLTEPRQGSQCSWEEFAGSLFSMGWRSQGRSIEIWSWSDFDPWFLLETFTFFAQSII